MKVPASSEYDGVSEEREPLRGEFGPRPHHDPRRVGGGFRAINPHTHRPVRIKRDALDRPAAPSANAVPEPPPHPRLPPRLPCCAETTTFRGGFCANRQIMRSMDYFATHPVFTHAESTVAHAEAGRSPHTIDNTLAHHLRVGCLLHARRILYATVPPEIDPYLVATKFISGLVVA